MGELYLPAVRSDKEECIVTHLAIPLGSGFQKA
jgi:hypothetical protein